MQKAEGITLLKISIFKKCKPMKNNYLLFFLMSFSIVKAQNFNEFAASIAEKYQLSYTLSIANDPISARNIFLNNDALVEDYYLYVTQQNPTWYLRYFSLNGLRKKGWNNHWELYNNRFLTWMDWKQSLFLSVASFEWYIPRNNTPFFNALNGFMYSPVELYRMAYFQEQWFVNQFLKNLNASLEEKLYDGNTTINTSSLRYSTADAYRKAVVSSNTKSKPVKNLKTVINSLRSSGVAYETVKQQPKVGYAYGASIAPTVNAFPRKDANAGNYRMYDSNAPMQSRANYTTPTPAVRVQTVVSPNTGYTPPSSGSTTAVSAGRKQ